MKKLLIIVCVITIIISVNPLIASPVLADEYSGTCGENATWKLDKVTGLLTISGTGDMDDFEISYDDYAMADTPWDNDKVKSVLISSGVTSIGQGAFASCWNLSKVRIADSVTRIGVWAFVSCHNLTSITIPKNVEIICATAFWDCKNLLSVGLPDNLKTIEIGVFSDCKSLTSIKIGSKLKSQLSNYIFDGSGLKSIRVSDKNEHYSSQKGVLYNKNKNKLIIYPPKKEEHDFIIPDSVKEINKYAFLSVKGLKSLTISKNVEKINNDAFSNNYLKSINVLEKNKYFCTNDNVLFNKSKTKVYLYLKSKKSKTYSVPNSVKKINNKAFYECKTLEKITLSKNLNIIGKDAFSNCDQLKSIIIPNSVKSIGNGAFSFCIKLSKAVIPNHVTFGDETFIGSADLKVYSNKNSFAAKHAKDWDFKFRCVISKSVKGIKVAKRTSTSINLKWKKIDGVKGYKIYDANQKKTVKTVTTNTTSATISCLKPGSKHQYKVRAYKIIADAKYYGYYSETITAKTK